MSEARSSQVDETIPTAHPHAFDRVNDAPEPHVSNKRTEYFRKRTARLGEVRLEMLALVPRALEPHMRPLDQLHLAAQYLAGMIREQRALLADAERRGLPLQPGERLADNDSAGKTYEPISADSLVGTELGLKGLEDVPKASVVHSIR